MKLLCGKCNEPMSCKREEGKNNEKIHLIFVCDSCDNKAIMMTNMEETNLINKINPELGKQQNDEVSTQEEEIKDESGEPVWTKEAESRLEKIPPFVRPMVMKGVEEFARERGIRTIDSEVMDKAKSQFGM
ncbi:MAG: hypothetical protein ACE5EA_02240 [Nitrospirota bacterium]